MPRLTQFSPRIYRGVAQHDIALLKLERPLKLNKLVAPVKLPTQNERQIGEAVLSGWGSISKKIIPVLPTVLQKAIVPILNNDDCLAELTAQEVIGQKPELFETQVCSGSAGKEISACSVSRTFLFTNCPHSHIASHRYWSPNRISFSLPFFLNSTPYVLVVVESPKTVS